MMPERRDSLLPRRLERQVWAVLRFVAPTAIGLGGVGTVVGIVSGQSVAIILLDVVVMIVGSILLLLVRWRR